MVTSVGSCIKVGIEGVGTVEMVRVGGLLMMHAWSITSTACVEICCRWAHWQRAV